MKMIERSSLLLSTILLVGLMFFLSCSSDDNDNNDEENDEDDDASPNNDDDTSVDDDVTDDDDDDDNNDDNFDKVLARYSLYTETGFRSFGLRSDGWHDEPLPEDVSMVIYADEAPDFAVGLVPLKTKDETAFRALIHYKDSEWELEEIPDTVTQVDLPASFGDFEAYTTASIYPEDSPQMGAHTKLLARQTDGSWEFEATPEISGDFNLIESPFIGPDGKARVMGLDAANETAFVLRRESTGWVEDPLPGIGVDTHWQCTTNHSGDCRLTTPDGEVWAWISDWENGCGVVLALQDSEWSRLTFPDPNGSWDIEDIKFCADGSAYAVGDIWLEEGSNRGLAYAYAGGVWTLETLPTESADWNLVHVYCDSNSIPWAIGEKEVDDEDIGLLLSKRSGAWAFEELLLSDTVFQIASLLFDNDGSPLLFGASGATSETRTGWIQSLTGDNWTALDLSALDFQYWFFSDHDSGITSDGTALAEGYKIDNELQPFLLERPGDTWSPVDAFGLNYYGWDLIVY